MTRAGRIITIAAGIITALLITAVLVLLSFYPAEYLRRLVTYGESDVYDYQIFPERAVQPSPNPIPFDPSPNPAADEARVRAWFEQDPLVGGDLDAFFERTSTQALIVIQGNTILYEEYAPGMQRDSVVTSFSAAKSFVSTLVGIAIMEGKINSVDDPITRTLPELLERDPRFEQITIRHLVDMNSGIKYVENGFVNGDDALTYYYPDLRSLALEQTRITGTPGAEWLYNNYHPLLLGVILERATGMPVSQYLEEKLWQPMGAEYPASWSLDSEETAFEKMESGINARAIDFAKLGRLYMNGGSIHKEQFVPPDWIQQATRMDPTVDRATYYPDWMDQPYGQVYHQHLWWGIQRPDGSYGYTAAGNFGQYIFVDPAKHLIIVRFGEKYGIESTEWFGLFMAAAEQAE